MLMYVLPFAEPWYATTWLWLVLILVAALAWTARQAAEARQFHAVQREVEVRRERALSEQLRHAAESANQNEHLFRQFLHNFPGAGFIKDREGRLVYANRAFEELFGLPLAKLAGLHGHQYLPASLAARVELEEQRVLAGRTPATSVDQVERPGRALTFQTTRFPILDGQGEVTLIGGLAVDITETHRAGEMLRLQGAALESAVDAMAIVTPEGRLKWGNPAFETLTGYAPEDLAGESLGVLDPEGQALGRGWFAGQVEAAEAWRGEMELKRRDGSGYRASVSLTPVFDEHSAVTHFVLIQQDATARLLAARAETAPAAVEEAAPEVEAKGTGVLVVEEEETLRRLLAESLEAAGFPVWTADGGAEAMAVYGAERGRIGLVLMDYGLPAMDGARTFLEFQERFPQAAVVLMAGRLDPTIKRGLLARGLRGWVQKPFSMPELVELLREEMR